MLMTARVAPLEGVCLITLSSWVQFLCGSYRHVTQSSFRGLAGHFGAPTVCLFGERKRRGSTMSTTTPSDQKNWEKRHDLSTTVHRTQESSHHIIMTPTLTDRTQKGSTPIDLVPAHPHFWSLPGRPTASHFILTCRKIIRLLVLSPLGQQTHKHP